MAVCFWVKVYLFFLSSFSPTSRRHHSLPVTVFRTIMSGSCVTLSALRTSTSALALVPMDVVNMVQHCIDVPGVGIFCRRNDCSEVIIHHSLDNETPQSTCIVSQPRFCLYGSPVAHKFCAPTVTLARQMLSSDASPLDTLTTIDVARGTERRPEWLDEAVAGDLLPAMASVTIALDDDRLLVPRHDMSFACVSKSTRTVRPTSLTFSNRNRSLGRAFLGARLHATPGAAIISCEDGGLCYYDAFGDAPTFIGRPEIYGAAGHITCMQTVPNTNTLFVGYRNRAMLFDFRAGFAPVMCSDAPLPLWTSAAFFSEHGIASWNSIVYDHAGFHIRSHCQYVDIRSPTQWGQLPHWNLPTDVAAHWAMFVPNIRRRQQQRE